MIQFDYMFTPQYYQGKSEEEIGKSAVEEGYHPMVIHNSPGDVYPPHSHKTTKLVAILEGSMKVRVKNKWFECKEFDKLIIPGNIEHEAVVGKDGCRFFWSEKS